MACLNNRGRISTFVEKIAHFRRRIIIEFHSPSHFTLTFHPHNHAVKSIILKNFKLLQNDPDTGRIFSQPPLISFKRDKNIGNFLVRSAFKTSEQPGTFKCARARCKTCPFIYNVDGSLRPLPTSRKHRKPQNS